jgi:hypothetical protein
MTGSDEDFSIVVLNAAWANIVSNVMEELAASNFRAC